MKCHFGFALKYCRIVLKGRMKYGEWNKSCKILKVSNEQMVVHYIVQFVYFNPEIIKVIIPTYISILWPCIYGVALCTKKHDRK